jgi:radical SAM superfamily enzyme YgiQ (UPF0313 family)
MRRLLNEKIDNPLRQDLPLSAALPFNSKYLSQQSPIIISALGCSNKCEFCAGSAFFNHEVKRLVSPKQLLEIIKAYINRYGITSARIIDDNFLYNKNYVKELGYLIAKDDLCQESRFSYTAFGNLAAISKYEYEELVENGISGLLIGVESKFVEELDANIRRKLLNIDAHNIFQNLHENGIHTEGSMILGWDFHTPSNIMDDINFYASLQATFDQILCLGPLPETKLWQQLKIEKRLFNDFSWEDIGFYGKWHRFKNFTHEQLWEYVSLAQKKCYETWGPSYLRLFEVQLKGYKKFIRNKNTRFQRVAKAHQLECMLMYPLLQSIKIYSPNERIRKRTVELRQEFIEEFGKPKLPDIIKSGVVTSIASWCKLKTIFINEHTIQPKSKTYCYN